jgi:hypothetical protein
MSFFVPAIILIAIIGTIYSAIAARKRREGLVELAQRLNLNFDAGKDEEIPERFSFLKQFDEGHDRYAVNVISGNYQQNEITIFDYIFGAGFHWSAFVLEMNTNFPDVLISHENIEARIAETFGGQQIAFESSDFSRIFRVRASDKKFAFDVCHSQMMEHLLANQDLTIEVSGSTVAILFEDWLHPENIESNLS